MRVEELINELCEYIAKLAKEGKTSEVVECTNALVMLIRNKG